MKLIQQIREAAVDGGSDLASLLRRAKVLATALRNADLRAWVNHELEGYPAGSSVPEYRRLVAPPHGNFVGPFGQQIKHYLLPISRLPDFLRERVQAGLEVRQPVKELASLVAADSGKMEVPWPVEAVILMRPSLELTGDFELVEAYQPIGGAQLEGVLDAVRNKLLDLVLALEEIAPDVVTSDQALEDIAQETVNRAVSVTIFGNQNLVASGRDINQSLSAVVSPGDMEALLKTAAVLGFDHTDIAALREALEQDGQQPKGSFGSRVQKWLVKLMTKGAEGAWDVSKATVPTLISKAIGQYYGWPS